MHNNNGFNAMLETKTTMTTHVDRCQAEYTQAVENIEWLSGPKPVYSCGTPVSLSDVHNLLKVNRSTAARLGNYLSQNSDHLKD